MKKILSITSAISILLYSGNSLANDSSIQNQINELTKQINALQERIANNSTANTATISFKPGPKIESIDGTYSMQIGGRLQADATFFQDDTFDYSDGTEIRRARIFVKGKLGDGWQYKFENDFGGNTSKIKDAYISYNGFNSTKIKLGQFKQPFSLEELDSSRFITFIERASLNVFALGRKIGFAATTNGNNWTISGGVFGKGANDKSSDDEGYSVTARATFAPIAEKNKALHLGVAGSYTTPDAGSSVRYRQRPEAHQTSIRTVDTGNILNVESINSIGLEVAGIFNSFSLQGEYISTTVKTETASNPRFSGYYGYASWFITGESRNYNAKKGVFGRIKPKNPFLLKGGSGAWEIATRYSNLSLNDGNINGGEMNNYTFALNWYPSNYTRIMTNYIISDSDGNSVNPNDSPNIFIVRAQVDF